MRWLIKNRTDIIGRVGTAAAGILLLLCTYAIHAQSFGDPLSGAVGDPLYSESQQVGPSSSLLPQGTSLTSANYRTGTLDPLGTLIESGSMSPYLGNVYLLDSYANVSVLAESLHDPVLVRNFDEYRNNRLLMAGTLPTGSLLGRASGAGGVVSGGFAARGAGAGSSFGRGTMLVPFAAGSSAMAHQQTGMLGFVDPNVLLASTTSGSAMAAMASQATASPTTQGSASPASSSTGASGAGGVFASGGASDSSTDSSSGQSSMTGMQSGPAPAQVFPMLAVSNPSTTGFQDSTMGTAGQPSFSETSSPFHAVGSSLDPDRASPFQDVSGQMSNFLHPSLLGQAPVSGAAMSTESVREYARKARLQAIVNNPGNQPPSPFEQRAMIKAYQAQHRRGGGRASRVTLAPSVVATP